MSRSDTSSTVSSYADTIDDVLGDEPDTVRDARTEVDKTLADDTKYRTEVDKTLADDMKYRTEVDKTLADDTRYPSLADDTQYLSVADDKEVKVASPADGATSHPFQQSNDSSDMRLIVEGRPLYVSKVVMSLVSPVLKSRFDVIVEDNVDLQLPGKKYNDILEFLKCVYPHMLNPITAQNVDIILPLADEYRVRLLVDKCEDFLIKDIERSNPKPHPDKIVHSLSLADKYTLEKLQKASFEAAAKTESDLLENVEDFWDLPSVTTTSVFIRRLKLLEQCGKNIRSKIKETQNHCSLYHKGERSEGAVCTKCYATIGKTTQAELKLT